MNTTATTRKPSARRTSSKAAPSRPKCCFCHRDGNGVQFSVFNPRFKPFGTACTDCEATLPAGTIVPGTTWI